MMLLLGAPWHSLIFPQGTHISLVLKNNTLKKERKGAGMRRCGGSLQWWDPGHHFAFLLRFHISQIFWNKNVICLLWKSFKKPFLKEIKTYLQLFMSKWWSQAVEMNKSDSRGPWPVWLNVRVSARAREDRRFYSWSRARSWVVGFSLPPQEKAKEGFPRPEVAGPSDSS